MRRGIDVAAASIGLLLLAPLFAAIAVAVRLSSPGPVFYRARRVGWRGRPLTMLKFRTMVVQSGGPAVTAKGDPRVTRVGRFLRRTKLDELPQLVHVLFGEMSLVGPRPEDPRYVALYDEAQRRILDVRPGITGAASLAYRDEESLLAGDDWERVYVERILPDKLRLDLEYEKTRTLARDLRLIVRTIF
ncbi:MAG TPA: sugar transferase [Thermoanaerobaculia bacterium]|nr:sugar transferase [Thermoanaerobaculia bacterium]